LSCLWLVSTAGNVAAQDAHYWTYGYGPIGQLTEGTLVGGVSDVSAIYYNPGALALLAHPSFVVGLTSVEFANLDAPGVAGEGLDADQLVFDIVPSMVAGVVGGGGGANRFAISLLSRHDSDWDLGLNDPNISGTRPSGSAGFGRVRQRLVEYWLGGTWSHRFSDRLSVGISPFLAYRAQRSRRSVQREEVSDSGSSRAAFFGIEHEYNHGRALAKVGLAWRPGEWELGATLTTPGVKIFSSGKAVFNASLVGEVSEPLISASTQAGLEATYHAPWAMAGGATWRGARSAVHSTVEWFSAVDPYDILEPEPAPVSGSPRTIPLHYSGAAASTVCFGVGAEHRFGSRLTLYAGAASNQSAYVAERDSLAAWDLTDFTLGFTLDSGSAVLAFGLGYAWGQGQIPQTVELPGSSEPTELVDARFSRWTISAGASFHGGRGR
jgi:hypothetical protein